MKPVRNFSSALNNGSLQPTKNVISHKLQASFRFVEKVKVKLSLSTPLKRIGVVAV